MTKAMFVRCPPWQRRAAATPATTWSRNTQGGGSRLARTGFQAWVVALIGGVALAAGLGLLAAQRRGKLNG